MIISIIAAVANNNVIGKDNKLPWHLPADLKHFKQITSGHCVIMGQTTFESIGHPLPNRTNIVMTQDKNYKAEGVAIAHSEAEALKIAENSGEQEAIVIGGATIYKLLLPKTNKIYLTKINADVDGDTYFPDLNMSEWKIGSKEEHKSDDNNNYDYEFVELTRR